MEAGDIVRIDLPQADGKVKIRPSLLLKQVAPYDDWIACGISSSLSLEVKGFDLIMDESSPEFPTSGLKHTSLIRLGFLSTRPKEKIKGKIGSLSKQTHLLLCNRLADHLRK
ncbi:MAG: type II toxin-antitoxin system PemK/MazF family toxin [Flavobacteriales bacterium]|nr:type II toxin-antitoxin system PemK/MazF family toxin [Flavobacteriales bacterium]